MITRRLLMLAASGAALLGGAGARSAAAEATPKPYSLDDFFGAVEVFDTALSPNGKLVAIAANVGPPDDKPRSAEHSRWGATAVLIVDALNPSNIIKTFRPDRYAVNQVFWAKADQLLVWLDITPDERRVVCMPLGEGAPVPLFQNKRATMQTVYDLGEVVDVLPDDPDHILMSAWSVGQATQVLYRVNVISGRAFQVEVGARHTFLWSTQGGVPMIRFDGDRDTVEVRARAPGETGWKYVRSFRTDQLPGFFLAGPTERAGVFVVGARIDDEDTISVRDLDLATLQFGPPRAVRPGHDATGAVVDQFKRYLGAVFTDDRVSHQFVDPTLAAEFNGIDAHFGHARNARIMDADRAQRTFLLSLSGPRDPGSFYIYSRDDRQLRRLGLRRPDLEPERLAPMEALKVTTRDGASIDAYLTAPLGGRPGPLVVLAHGGPEIRDQMDFDVWAQALAAQGWWVLQPNFRGSGGYGLAFAEAGWRHWGDLMQADVEDAVDQAVAAKGLDRTRLAIMGASYGGYAALMGAVRRPNAYRAAVSIAGPSDLPGMLRWEQTADRTGDPAAYEFWRARMGDPDTDRAMLEAASPLARAAEIKAAVLLIHGNFDATVPITQPRAMAKALKAAGGVCELYEMDAGHSHWSPDHEKEVLRRSIDFLAAHLA